MAYEMVMPYHLHMPSYFLETFTEYPYLIQPASCIKNAELSYTVTERNTLHGFFSVVLYRISEPDSRCTPHVTP